MYFVIYFSRPPFADFPDGRCSRIERKIRLGAQGWLVRGGISAMLGVMKTSDTVVIGFPPACLNPSQGFGVC